MPRIRWGIGRFSQKLKILNFQNLKSCKMCTSHTSVYLTGVYLIEVHLTGVHLMGMCLTGVYLIDMHLIGVHLTGMCLMSAYLIGVISWTHILLACIS